jgi:tRNA threonylcarbamoyladenosine biosynthesis protein TsaB
MLIAALDTATLALSCALCEVEDGEVRLVAERSERAPAKPHPKGSTGGHAARLPGVLQELLLAAGRRLADVEGYAVGLGPGSFTGLRIGIASWKGLAYGNRRPIAGASSLAALALGANPGAAPGALLVPLLDARKGEVYAGFYRPAGSGLEAVAPDAVLPAAALAERLEALAGDGARPVLFGEGLSAYPERLAAFATLGDAPSTPPALAVARLCAAALSGARYDAAHLFALEPHYVRLSEAEVKFPGGFGTGADRR